MSGRRPVFAAVSARSLVRTSFELSQTEYGALSAVLAFLVAVAAGDKRNMRPGGKGGILFVLGRNRAFWASAAGWYDSVVHVNETDTQQTRTCGLCI